MKISLAKVYPKTLLIYTFISSIIMFGLHALSKIDRIEKNGFSRTIHYVASKESSTSLNRFGYYFSSISGTKIQLGNVSRPRELLCMDDSLKTANILSLKGLDTIKLTWNAAKMQIIDTTIIIYEGISPKLIIGSTKDNRMYPVADSFPYFISMLPINQNAFILRSFSSSLSQSVLKLYNRSSEKIQNQYLLGKQVDGVICSDGTLDYNEYSNNFVYTYRYINKFILLDSNLNLLYQANTIDTNYHAKIEVSEIKKGVTALSSPPKPVNIQSCVADNYLFIQSQLRADNEMEISLDKKSAVDIYSLADGQYHGSFYIPLYQNQEKLTSFRVSNSDLYAIYGKELIKYKLFNKLQKNSGIFEYN